MLVFPQIYPLINTLLLWIYGYHFLIPQDANNNQDNHYHVQSRSILTVLMQFKNITFAYVLTRFLVQDGSSKTCKILSSSNNKVSVLADADDK